MLTALLNLSAVCTLNLLLFLCRFTHSFYKDGSEILIEQKGKNPRKITPREAARLQGYKDSFRPHKSNTEAYKQFGNSVAIPVVEAVSKQILEQILES